MKSGGEQGRKGRRVLWLATAAAAGLLAVSATAASAEAQDKRIAIPAEDASASIPALARQSGLQVFAPTDAVRGVRTNPVNGTYSPMEALNRLLAGTGLHAVQTGDNAVTIRRGEAPDGQAQQTNSPQSGPPPASDQSTNTVGEVVVTGTRIKRAGFDTLQAAYSTDAKEIDQRGYENIMDALMDTPGFGIPGSSPLSSQQARVGVAQSYADFFGLGSQRTLTLVDGQRFVSSNTVQVAGSNASPGDQVDLNLIPVGLVDHVETVAIGGAPVYGSDAIAGTVNIILKQHFSGVQMTAQYGLDEEHGDGQHGSVSVLAGTNFADGRGNVVFSAEYDQQDGILFSARSSLPFTFPNAAGTGTIFVDDVHFSFMTEGGLPYDGNLLNVPGLNYPGATYPPPATSNLIHNAAGQPLMFDKSGNLVPFNVGTVVATACLAPGACLPVESTGGDGVNAADHFSLLSPTKRFMMNFNGHYDLSNDTRFFWESSYAHTESQVLSDITSIDAPNLFSSAAYTLNFSVNNPYLSAADKAILTAPYNYDPLLGPQQTFQLSRNLNDVVDTSPAQDMENVYRLVTGLDGHIHPFNEDWTWNVTAEGGASYTESRDTYINPTNLVLAMDAVPGPGGSIVCASGGNCVPIDLFGVGNASKAAIAYVTEHPEATSLNVQFDINANLSGNLPFSIGGAAPVAFNVGAEHRYERDQFNSNAAWEAGDVLDSVPGYGPASGHFNTNEIYGETKVPIISPSQDNPLIKGLEFDGAVRYVSHSITGGAVTWSSGGELFPRLAGWGDGLEFRGVFTHSIRSPAIAELDLPQTGQLEGITDPCGQTQYKNGPDPSVREANCTAALAAIGAGTPANFAASTAVTSQQGFTSGNPNLKDETANSWSAGVVYQPTLAPRFRISADYSNIAMKNEIALLDISESLDLCYDAPNYPNVPECSAFTRLTASTIGSDPKSASRVIGDIAPGFQDTYFNIATLNFAGVILAAQYGFDLPHEYGSMTLSTKYFYTAQYDQLPFAGSPVIHGAGTVVSPRDRASFNVDYAVGKFETLWQVQWTGKSEVTNPCGPTVLPECYIASYALINASFAYKITPTIKAQLGVDNVFNKEMPFLALAERLFSTYDALGRRYMFRISASF